MIEIHHERLNDQVFMQAVKSGHIDNQLPLVFFLHGFTSAKEHNLHFAYLLAEKGFRVILPDANLHGEREDGKEKEKLIYEFWNIVLQSISELDQIRADLSQKKLITDQIGVVGTSMGGITMFGALTQYDWIKAGVSLMGSPNYEELARGQIDGLKKAGVDIPLTNEELEQLYSRLRPYDLSSKPDLLAGRPLFIWHGRKDGVVPFQPTFDFYQEVKNDYGECPDRLQLMGDEEAGHKVSREALLKTVDWFDHFLLS